MKRLKQFIFRYPVQTTCVFIFMVLGIFAVLSEGSHAGADDIYHYMHARWGFKHPELLLNHWAKPFFTLVASPFAQVGFWGMKLMNVLMGLCAAFLAKKVAEELGIANSYIALVMTVFMPVYTVMMISGNNEIMTSLMLVGVVYLFLRGKYGWTALIMSFMPLVRNETIVFFPFLGLLLLIKKRFVILPLFLTGFLLYSVVGYFYYDDFFWLITKMPYTGDAEHLGQGNSFFDFVKRYYAIFGIPLTITLVTGLIKWGSELFHPKRILHDKNLNILLLIYLPAITYFAAHSYVWWKGMGNSGGRIRVMACIIPLAAIISLQGYNFLSGLLKRVNMKIIIRATGILFFAYSIYYPFVIHPMPVPTDFSYPLVKEAALYIKTNGYTQGPLVSFQDPRFVKFLDGDPYSWGGIHYGLYYDKEPGTKMALGDIAIYDEHFARFDFGIPLENYMNSKQLKLIHIICPDEPVSMFHIDGIDTYMYIFQKTDESGINNYKLLQELKSLRYSENMTLLKTFPGIDSQTDSLFCKVTPDQQYNCITILKHDDIIPSPYYRFIIACEYTAHNTVHNPEIFLVASIEKRRNAERNYRYRAIKLNTQDIRDIKTTSLLVTHYGPFRKNMILKVYLWNKSGSEITINNLSIYQHTED